MKEVNEILQELHELNSPLAGFSRNMPYQLPDAYTDQMAENLMNHVSVEEAAAAAWNFSKAMPFDVPDGYFSSLPETLAHKGQQCELEGNISSPYQVNPGYFESLPSTLLNVARESGSSQQKGRAVRLITRRTIQWAAAAILLLSLSLGTYQYIQFHSPGAVASRQLLQINSEELGHYMEQHLDEFDAESLETAVASTKTDLKTSLSTIDEQEIQNYLYQTGDTNTATLN